ncbi:MAG: hypothetical protein KBD66_00840 [Candidatus Doudnabacteria bacterium]|nr:hypothetical protein [Candidatus Doudnabacteria bacterium]
MKKQKISWSEYAAGLEPEVRTHAVVPKDVSAHDAQMAQLLEGVSNIAQVVLVVVGVAGAVALAVAAPNSLRVLHRLRKVGRKFGRSGQSSERTLSRTFFYLKKHKYITFRSTKQGVIVRLTKRGRDRITKIAEMPRSIPVQPIWDKKWWLIASDIPTKTHGRVADLFRLKLKQLNVYALQRSLWVYPYDPRAELSYLLGYFHIERYVTIMEVSRMDASDEEVLRRAFKKILNT